MCIMQNVLNKEELAHWVVVVFSKSPIKSFASSFFSSTKHMYEGGAPPKKKKCWTFKNEWEKIRESFFIGYKIRVQRSHPHFHLLLLHCRHSSSSQQQHNHFLKHLALTQQTTRYTVESFFAQIKALNKINSDTDFVGFFEHYLVLHVYKLKVGTLLCCSHCAHHQWNVQSKHHE